MPKNIEKLTQKDRLEIVLDIVKKLVDASVGFGISVKF